MVRPKVRVTLIACRSRQERSRRTVKAEDGVVAVARVETLVAGDVEVVVGPKTTPKGCAAHHFRWDEGVHELARSPR